MTNKSMFRSAKERTRWLRVLLYGPEKTGKTRVALTFPKAAVFDTEDGTKLFSATCDFSSTISQGLNDLHASIDYLMEHPGEHETFIVDSISTIYSNMVASYMDDRGRVSYDKWSVIHTTLKALYNRLVLLPCHVVVTAHEASRYVSQQKTIERIGIKADADDALPHFADIIVRTIRPTQTKDGNRQYGGFFEAVRGIKLARPEYRDDISFEMFAKVAQFVEQTKQSETPSDATGR